MTQADTIEDGRYWFTLATQGMLPENIFDTKKLNWNVDIHERLRDEGRASDQFFVRSSVTYLATSKSSYSFGFDYLVNHPPGKSSLDEQRLWQQFSYKFDPLANVNFSSRTRLESRWREDGDETAFRLRQMIRASVPLPIKPSISAVIYDELFVNLNETDWGSYRGIDQNRLFLGFNWAFNANTALEMGYINQYINTRTIDRENHIVSTTLKLTF